MKSSAKLSFWRFIAISAALTVAYCPLAALPPDPKKSAIKPRETTASTFVAEQLQKGKKPNRLISEKSPYLLQHAFNPVDWYAWGPQAFEKAQRENKPIFVSIGYSTCHWCHVMEQESFEDPSVAKLMNDVFVSIKVDREERPDIDNVYMTVCQMMTGSGGWPLTIVMTPDKKPFFAGTYFPKESRFGRIGMLELVPRIQSIWSTQREKVLSSANQITAVLQQTSSPSRGEALGEPTMKAAFEQLSQRFDASYGGFDKTQKFPTPHNLLFLLRYWKRTSEKSAINMVEKTLDSMRRGGIYDHVGFGFHRYSTDPKWLVPHFEKMLYDQALLALAYIEAYQATGKEAYKKTVQEIFDYVLRDLTSPAGGFYSAEDADSEGEEGKFYLWTEKEIYQVLQKEEAELVTKLFAIEKNGNFVESVAGQGSGTNILHLNKSLKEVAADLQIPEWDLQTRWEAARQKLFLAREKRVHPHKDDKILTDWNGLMIAAFAKGAQLFEESKYMGAGKRAADFILKQMRKRDGRLLHRYRDGQAAVEAHLDDYIFLVWGLIELYETTFDVHYLQTALELINHALKHFWDYREGAFYFTADDSEALLTRRKEIYDGAIPSGNSVAMLNLIRLARMTANSELETKAADIARAFSKTINPSPSAHAQLMVAVAFGVGPSYEVVIAGGRNANDTRAMLKALRREFIPNKVVLFRPSDQRAPKIFRYAKFTQYQPSIQGKATAYVCQNYNCKFPTTDIDKMLELLSVKRSKTATYVK